MSTNIDIEKQKKIFLDFQRKRNILINNLKNHILYKNLKSIHDIQIFMESHVYAVWDFMSLLKSLQVELTGTLIPWTPKKNPVLTRFINEIVQVEESDLDYSNQPKSHFQMYLESMEEINADTRKINYFIELISKNINVDIALSSIKIDSRIKEFVNFSFKIINTKKAHLIASAFTYGRENLIPEIFIKILNEVEPDKKQYSKLKFYLDRHIEVDGEMHGPLANKMMEELCNNDNEKWKEAFKVGEEALKYRLKLWDAINELILLNRVQTKDKKEHFILNA